MSGISSVVGIVKYQYFVQKKVVSLVKLSGFHALKKLIFIEAFDEFTSNFAFAKKGCSFEHLIILHYARVHDVYELILERGHTFDLKFISSMIKMMNSP